MGRTRRSHSRRHGRLAVAAMTFAKATEVVRWTDHSFTVTGWGFLMVLTLIFIWAELRR